MHFFRIHRVWEFFAGLNLAMGILWLGLALFTIGLFIIRYTRWGQSHKLEKCMGLSVLAHLLILGYIATISFVATAPRDGEEIFYVAYDDGDSEQGDPSGKRSAEGDETGADSEQPWEALQHEIMLQPKETKLISSNIISDSTQPAPAGEAEVPDKMNNKSVLLDAPQTVSVDLDTQAKLLPIDASSELPGEPISEQTVTEKDVPSQATPAAISGYIGRLVPLDEDQVFEATKNPEAHSATDMMPDIYKLRVMPNRAGVAERHGATTETERAVQAALKWLANNQTADGHWQASQHGAGRELSVQGRNRQNAGRSADSGITGLALLAFLASGNTHQQGPFCENVRDGLEYLLRIQARDGNLGGSAQTFEFMYCHAMAACALSEAYGMTHDPRLESAVRRGIDFTIAAQDPRGGGWRYRPGDPGDTSQLGWQLMALKSAELAGIAMPAATRNGMIRFLKSVSVGTHGGLASYRPGEQISRAMTAEALVCRQFLGFERENPSCDEAGDYLLGELPGQGIANDYYWYYATLGMYQLQGEHWEKWNQSMRCTLLDRQVKEGPMAGSWNTDTLWGSYGGRVYTTAIATLTLEVYYRFLPLYLANNQSKQQVK